MGLDMYLHRKTYVKNWGHMSDTEKHQITVKKGNKKHPYIDNDKISSIEEEVGCWRKANQIHRWFVENIQENDDNCEEYSVSHEQLKQLLTICIEVLVESKLVAGIVKNGASSSKETGYMFKDNLQVGKVVKDFTYAEQHLPAQEGFFFGGTDYDQYYYDDVLETVKMLQDLQNEDEEFEGDFYYSSSW